MNLGLADRVVLVTGASKGIGYACAEAFAAEGARVAIASRSRANLDAALARWPHPVAPLAVAADLCRADAAQRLVDEVEAALGPIDVLADRIAVLGWSHGGSAVLAALDGRAPSVAAWRDRSPQPAYFRAGVAFYPGCGALAKARRG